MSDVTRLIDAAAAGDPKAAADLLPLVYDELRRLAAAKMAAEAPGHTLEATGLVHEAYLRLIGPADAARWDGRGHFFAAAAEAMRRILVDHARAKHAEKRGSRPRAEIDPNHLAAPADDPDRWLDLDRALARFEAIDPVAAKLAAVRVFAGRSVEEAGDAVGLSRATAFRKWTFARAWLTAHLGDPESEDS